MLASIKALLESVVDYAGLFPPAKLTLQEAMANYAQEQMSSYNWMLGHFVLPISRLDELEALVPSFPLKQWSLSVIVSGNLESALERLLLYGNNDKIAIAALEFPPVSPTAIQDILPLLPQGVDAFFEIPLAGDLEAYLSVLQSSGAMAKIRTGGITVEAFPSITQLSQFIFAFAEAKILFKATAGLHHPLWNEYRLTYELASPSTIMHGFLNVTVLAALVYWQKVTFPESLKILKASSLDSFQFTNDGISWNDFYLTLSHLKESRQCFFRSFGSCSFKEPINDLKHWKLLS